VGGANGKRDLGAGKRQRPDGLDADPGRATRHDDTLARKIDAGGDFGRCRMKSEWCGKTLHCDPRAGSCSYLRHCARHVFLLILLTVSRRKWSLNTKPQVSFLHLK